MSKLSPGRTVRVMGGCHNTPSAPRHPLNRGTILVTHPLQNTKCSCHTQWLYCSMH